MSSVLRITNPATGEQIAELPADDAASVAAKAARARAAQPAWAARPLAERKAAIVAFRAARRRRARDPGGDAHAPRSASRWSSRATS